MRFPKFRPVKQCIFCGNKAASKEHGWSDWALARFEHLNHQIFGEIDGIAYHDPHQKQVLVKCVCIPCNTGWMKHLEDTILPTVSCMMRNITVTIDIPEQRAISRWATKTAMVWENVSRTTTPFYLFHDCDALRLSGTIPPNTFIWLARHLGPQSFVTKGNPATGLLGDAQVQALVTTFAYGYLVVQVVSLRSNANTNFVGVLHGELHRWERHIIPIWPTSPHAAWPPKATIGPADLDDFHTRMTRQRPR